MNTTQLALSLCLTTALAGFPILAHEAHSQQSRPSAMKEEQGIAQVMKRLFEKPDAPLKVIPVSIEGSHAVAGWIQHDKGGRALLRKDGGKWSIQVCGGDGLKQASALALAGVPQAAAVSLAQKIAAAEQQLPVEVVRKLAMFDGIVKVDGTMDGPHGSGHGHTAHSK